mmetsp:Transcript_32325/g.43804  ORF Transcript_32325/g.43804 Transcript_32325/m.43804 type:complete len:285 (-) Transcript_32325:3-857(-)
MEARRFTVLQPSADPVPEWLPVSWRLAMSRPSAASAAHCLLHLVCLGRVAQLLVDGLPYSGNLGIAQVPIEGLQHRHSSIHASVKTVPGKNGGMQRPDSLLGNRSMALHLLQAGQKLVRQRVHPLARERGCSHQGPCAIEEHPVRDVQAGAAVCQLGVVQQDALAPIQLSYKPDSRQRHTQLDAQLPAQVQHCRATLARDDEGLRGSGASELRHNTQCARLHGGVLHLATPFLPLQGPRLKSTSSLALLPARQQLRTKKHRSCPVHACRVSALRGRGVLSGRLR